MEKLMKVHNLKSLVLVTNQKNKLYTLVCTELNTYWFNHVMYIEIKMLKNTLLVRRSGSKLTNTTNYRLKIKSN